MILKVRRKPRRPYPRLAHAKREGVVPHITGLVLFIASVGMLVSAGVDLVMGGDQAVPFLTSALLVGGPGALMWRRTRPPDRLTPASVYAAVLGAWVFLSVVSAVPYLATGVVDRVDDALFEGISGITTTGSTILRPISTAGAGLLFWRSLTQWLGGIGVVVLAISVLPFLGVGGMELLRAEAPGPTSERLVPRVRETAQRLVTIYVGFTLAIATAYTIFGMSLYDAVTHAFTTIATGGFSTRDASFAEFGSAALEWTAVVSMFAAGGNFALYWAAIKGRPGNLLRSPEARAYALLMLAFCGAAVAWNVATDGFTHDNVRHTTFSVIAIASTTGYGISDYNLWPGALQLVLVFAMGLGGMAGSTTGGFKVFRLLGVLAYGRRQVVRQLHPRAVSVVRIGKDPVPEDLVDRIVGFFAIFMAIGALATLLVASFGPDMRTAISAVACTIGNVGPGLGDVGPMSDFLEIPAASRAVLMVVMIVGRLEIFPVLLGLVPLWRYMRNRLPLTRLPSRDG